MNGECRPVAVGPYTKISQTFDRALAIETLGKVVDCGRAFGYCGNHRQTVTDGFISRYGGHSAQSLGRLDLQTMHSWRLARSLTLHKTSCYQGAMASKGRRMFELTIPSRLEEMQAVHALIAKAVKEYRLTSEMAHWIELSISESMINAIQHGNKADPAKQATLRISSSGDAIEIIVEDEGCGFTLDNVADPTDKANLLKPSGRGILIIRSFMDEVDLLPREGGGCRLRMVKKIRGDGAEHQ